MKRIIYQGQVYRWSNKERRWCPARSLIPAWFRDDPLTATLAYLAVLGMTDLGALVVVFLVLYARQL